MSNFFSRFVNNLVGNQSAVTPEVEAQLPVETVGVDTVGVTEDTVTLQANIGLRTIELSVSPNTTYREIIKLAQAQVPGMNVAEVTVLNIDNNQIVQNLDQPVTASRVSLESTAGTAG
jgi:hypothetical protein